MGMTIGTREMNRLRMYTGGAHGFVPPELNRRGRVVLRGSNTRSRDDVRLDGIIGWKWDNAKQDHVEICWKEGVTHGRETR